MEGGDAEVIARKCIDAYFALPKNGKPRKGVEWTILAGVVKENEVQDSPQDRYEVVALGTGTKCIGPSKMRDDGMIVHDSHAEIVARRAFLRYVYSHLLSVYNSTESEIFSNPCKDTGTCDVRENVRFHFYISHTPCGDASIIPIKDETMQDEPHISSGIGEMKRKHKNTVDNTPSKKQKFTNNAETPSEEPSNHGSQDILRTGGKPVAGEAIDPLLPGCNYHTVGSLRNKPGRGEATLSMSCSDKIARWNVLGCLGAMLSHFVPNPLYFSSVIIGKCPYSADSMHRALYSRISSCKRQGATGPHLPLFLQTAKEFEENCRDGLLPCGSSIAWAKVPDRSHEVCANGYRLGVTRKKWGTRGAQGLISKRSLFENFLEVKELVPKDSKLFLVLNNKHLRSYREYKDACTEYQRAWSALRTEVLPNWILHDRRLDDFIISGNGEND